MVNIIRIQINYNSIFFFRLSEFIFKQQPFLLHDEFSLWPKHEFFVVKFFLRDSSVCHLFSQTATQDQKKAEDAFLSLTRTRSQLLGARQPSSRKLVSFFAQLPLVKLRSASEKSDNARAFFNSGAGSPGYSLIVWENVFLWKTSTTEGSNAYSSLVY